MANSLPQGSTLGPRETSLQLGFKDIWQGLAYWQLWGRLGWNDIVQRYRRSLLGPFWMTASMAIMVIALGVIYARLFKMNVSDLMPYLSAGLLAWGLIGSVVNEAGMLFTSSETFIKQIRLPYSIYVYRFIWSRMIIFAHNIVVYFGVILYFQLSPGFIILLALPGIALVMLNGTLVSVYLGMASARFRDIPQIISSVFQVVFFVTPVFWKADMLGANSLLIKLNPFYHFVEVVRAPMLGAIPATSTYIAIALITVVNAGIAFAFFVRFRSRIAFWI